MDRDLTGGPVMRTMLLFAVPMILGNLLQQCYNIADTMIVGKFLGKNALAAVGSSFALAYALSARVGVTGIWWSVPIGWLLADAVGLIYYGLKKPEKQSRQE